MSASVSAREERTSSGSSSHTAEGTRIVGPLQGGIEHVDGTHCKGGTLSQLHLTALQLQSLGHSVLEIFAYGLGLLAVQRRVPPTNSFFIQLMVQRALVYHP